jgi:hypothetical protein
VPSALQRSNPRFQAAVLYHWGNALLSQANWTQAEQKFQKAYDLWEKARVLLHEQGAD